MYIGDYQKPITSAQEKAAIAFPMVLLALAIGFVVGVTIWGIFLLSKVLIHLVWVVAPRVVSVGPYATFALCSMGGIIVGLWNYFTGIMPSTLEDVMATIKKTGTYKLEGGLFKNMVGFLLPLVFGGSIGPEAGMTGIIAGACAWVSNRLKRAGVAAKSVVDLTLSASLSAIFGTPFLGIVAASEDVLPDADQLEFRRYTKVVLYTATAFGAFAGIIFIKTLSGISAGLPHFGSMQTTPQDLIWFPLLALGGYALALVFRLFDKVAKLAQAICDRGTYSEVFKPIVCGIALGLFAMVFPDVLFSGEEQTNEIQSAWMNLSLFILFGTALAKLFMTTVCLHMGWHGGLIFPLIFAGVSAGYGFAALLGVDPVFCVAITSTSLVAAAMRKPLMAVALVMLCFPFDKILWFGLAALIASSLPVPSILQSAEDTCEGTVPNTALGV